MLIRFMFVEFLTSGFIHPIGVNFFSFRCQCLGISHFSLTSYSWVIAILFSAKSALVLSGQLTISIPPNSRIYAFITWDIPEARYCSFITNDIIIPLLLMFVINSFRQAWIIYQKFIFWLLLLKSCLNLVSFRFRFPWKPVNHTTHSETPLFSISLKISHFV